MMKLKQIIVMRTDLNMRKGKMIAQGCHASLSVTLANIDNPYIKEWLAGTFTKIVVRAESEKQLLMLHDLAKDANLLTTLITDAGRTEFNGVPTNTCIAIGPATHEELLPITGKLKLL